MYPLYVSPFRFLLPFIVLLLSLNVAVFRLFSLHFLEAATLKHQAQANREKTYLIKAKRGMVVDRNNQVLACSRLTYQVGVDPQLADRDSPKQFFEAEKILKLPHGSFQRKVAAARRKSRWRKVRDEVPYEQYEQLKHLKLKSVYGNAQSSRHYPSGKLAAHLLGFLNHNGTATGGVEAAFDFYLKGQDGWMKSELDARRKELPYFREMHAKAKDGLKLTLTLDKHLQHLVEGQIDQLVAQYSPESVIILISDVSTSDVLAMGNYPSFNPNFFERYSLDTYRNRAITDTYEPGSVFKIVTHAASLEEGITHLNMEINCNQSKISYRGRDIPLPTDHRALGMLKLTDTLRKSSNRAAALLGVHLGEERLYRYIKAFGFGEKTLLGLPGESRGQLLPPSKWDNLTISRLPIGYAIGVTALQMHQAMCVIASGGIGRAPRLLLKIEEAGGATLHLPTRLPKVVIAPETAKVLTTMLKKVTEAGGTARRASFGGFSIAGKTGTSQKIIGGAYSRHHHIASFSGFFPADQPKLTITVIVDNPKIQGLASGGRVAAPAFAQLGRQAASFLHIR